MTKKKEAPVVERLLLRPHEAAIALGVSRAKMYELIASGEIPSMKVGTSSRIPVDALKRVIAERVTGGAKP